MKCAIGILLGAGCLAMLVYEIEGFCGYTTKDSPGPTCKTPEGTIKVGESVTSYTKCLTYTCEKDIVSFCGIGYNDRQKIIKGCKKQKLENCCYRFVKKDDPSIVCLEKKCPS